MLDNGTDVKVMSKARKVGHRYGLQQRTGKRR